jgi:hypothetical protein
MNPASSTPKPPISPTMSSAIDTCDPRVACSNWLVVSRRAPVLPDTEDQRQQEYQSGCQQGDSGVDAQMPVHCPAESS